MRLVSRQSGFLTCSWNNYVVQYRGKEAVALCKATATLAHLQLVIISFRKYTSK